MPEGPLDEDADWSPDAFQDWLAQIAEAEDIPQQEVLNRMMSAYWILDEFADLMEESNREVTHDPPDGEVNTEAVDRLTQSINALHDTLSEQPQRSESEPRHGDDPSERRLDRLDRQVDRVHDDIDQLFTRLDRVSSQVHSLSDDLRNELDTLSERVRQQSDRSHPSEEEFSEITDHLSSITERLTRVENRQRKIREQVNSDFENVEDILRYLVARNDDFDGRLDTIDRANERLLSEHETLADIKQEANRHGAKKAKCEVCGDTVDVRLLERPECPHCERPFDGLSPKQGWFGSHTLSVGSGSGRADDARDIAPDPEPEPDDDPPDPPEPDAGAELTEKLGIDDIDSLDDEPEEDPDEFTWGGS